MTLGRSSVSELIEEIAEMTAWHTRLYKSTNHQEGMIILEARTTLDREEHSLLHQAPQMCHHGGRQISAPN